MHELPNFEDARLALRLYDLRRETELRKARTMIGTHVWGQPWEKVKGLFDYDHPENAHMRQVTGYWEMASSFVNRGIFHPAVFLDTCSEAVFTYTCFHPHLAAIRESRPRFLAQTEKVIQDIPAVRERFDQTLAMFEAWKAAEAEKKAKKGRKSPRKKPAAKRKKR